MQDLVAGSRVCEGSAIRTVIAYDAEPTYQTVGARDEAAIVVIRKRRAVTTIARR